MTAELTAEEIVTSLLSSNEILNPTDYKLFNSNLSSNLGKILLKTNRNNNDNSHNSKYTFINGKWEI